MVAGTVTAAALGGNEDGDVDVEMGESTVGELRAEGAAERNEVDVEGERRREEEGGEGVI